MYLFHVAANMQTNIFLLKQLAVELWHTHSYCICEWD